MSVLLPLNISKGLRWPLFRLTLECAKCLLWRAPGRALCSVHFPSPSRLYSITGLRYKTQFCKTDQSKAWKDKRNRVRSPPRIKTCLFSCLNSTICAFLNTSYLFFGGGGQINTNDMQSGEFKTAMNKSSQRSSSVLPPVESRHLAPSSFPPSTLRSQKSHYWIIYIVQIKIWTVHALCISPCTKHLFLFFKNCHIFGVTPSHTSTPDITI